MQEQEIQNVDSQAQAAVENVDGEVADNISNIGQEQNLDDALSGLLDGKENPNEPLEELKGEPKKELEFDWTKDGRYKEMWKEDPNNMFRSYREAEKQLNEYRTFKTDLEGLKSKFESQGIDVNKLDDYIKEYQELKSPDNPKNQDLEFIYSFLQKPQYADKVANFFRELSLADLQERFPNMNNEQIQAQMRMESELKALKEERAKEVEEKNMREFQSRQESGVKKIKEFSDSRGFTMNDEQLSRFVDSAVKEGVTPENYHAHFIYMFGKELDEAYNRKMEENYLKRLNNNNKATIPNSKTINSSNVNGKSLSEALDGLL